MSLEFHILSMHSDINYILMAMKRSRLLTVEVVLVVVVVGSVPLIIHADRHLSGWLNVRGRHNQKAEPSQFGGTIFPRHNRTMLRQSGSFSQRDACGKMPEASGTEQSFAESCERTQLW